MWIASGLCWKTCVGLSVWSFGLHGVKHCDRNRWETLSDMEVWFFIWKVWGTPRLLLGWGVLFYLRLENHLFRRLIKVVQILGESSVMIFWLTLFFIFLFLSGGADRGLEVSRSWWGRSSHQLPAWGTSKIEICTFLLSWEHYVSFALLRCMELIIGHKGVYGHRNVLVWDLGLSFPWPVLVHLPGC